MVARPPSRRTSRRPCSRLPSSRPTDSPRAAEFADALQDKSYRSTAVTAPVRRWPTGTPAAGSARGRWSLCGSAVALLLAIAAALWGWLRPGPAPAVQPLQPLPAVRAKALQPSVNGSINVAITADGKRVAYVGPGEGGGRLWLREHDKLRPAPDRRHRGRHRARSSPPTGGQIGFLVGGRTVKVDLARTAVRPITPDRQHQHRPEATGARTATSTSRWTSGLGRIRATGGPHGAGVSR